MNKPHGSDPTQEIRREVRRARKQAYEARLRAREARHVARQVRYQRQPIEAGPIRTGLISGSFFLVVGSAFLADSMDLLSFDPIYIWPLIAISFGLSEVMGRSTRQKVEKARTTQLTVAEERVRIARELHDIVAHSVSLMTVQIAAARRVFHKKPDEAESALEAAESTGRQSLAELRTLVNILRSADASIEAASFTGPRESDDPDNSAPLPGLGDIQTLVAGMREAGMQVRLTVSGERPDPPPGVQLAVYRVLQEALTNTIRHGTSAPVDVTIRYQREEIELTVDNESDPDSALSKDEGHGVIGMRERVAAVGGKIEAGPSPDGRWRVRASIPVSGPQ